MVAFIQKIIKHRIMADLDTTYRVRVNIIDAGVTLLCDCENPNYIF